MRVALSGLNLCVAQQLLHLIKAAALVDKKACEAMP